MTAPSREQVIEWALEAGFTVRNGVVNVVHGNGSWVAVNERLAEFATLAFAAGQAAQGGAAFPQPCTAKGSAANSPFGIADDCMTVRDYLAAHAPVELGTMLKVYGDENADLFLDNVRASYMAILAMVRYEYADAMLTEREKGRAVEAAAGKECAEPKSDGWVSVLDRLPEKNEMCAIYLSRTQYGGTYQDGSAGRVDFDSWRERSYGKDWESYQLGHIARDDDFSHVGFVVTHWMPIPPPLDASKTPISDEERDRVIDAIRKVQK